VGSRCSFICFSYSILDQVGFHLLLCIYDGNLRDLVLTTAAALSEVRRLAKEYLTSNAAPFRPPVNTDFIHDYAVCLKHANSDLSYDLRDAYGYQTHRY
jgi:hypothetical protein